MEYIHNAVFCGGFAVKDLLLMSLCLFSDQIQFRTKHVCICMYIVSRRKWPFNSTQRCVTLILIIHKVNTFWGGGRERCAEFMLKFCYTRGQYTWCLDDKLACRWMTLVTWADGLSLTSDREALLPWCGIVVHRFNRNETYLDRKGRWENKG